MEIGVISCVVCLEGGLTSSHPLLLDGHSFWPLKYYKCQAYSSEVDLNTNIGIFIQQTYRIVFCDTYEEGGWLAT